MMEKQPVREQNRRYPGPRPFTYKDRHVFRGRDREVTELVEHLRQYTYMLLYARSGIGKSSLIEAGLLPELDRLGGYVPFKIVFGAYNKKAPIPPLDAAILHLEKSKPQLGYLDKLIFKENSLWYQLKSLQAQNNQTKGSKGSQASNEKQVLLIFDQFEELFTYPAEDIYAFKQGLSEMLFAQIPDVFRAALRDKAGSTILSEEELELLHRPLNVRVLFSIRSDRMALLNRLTDCLPEILRNFYEIRPLTREQSSKAITGPAEMDKSFDSPSFTYDPVLLNDMLDFLARDQEQYIESFQLQIICKYIEDLVMESTDKKIVTKSDVPVLEDIFLNFYKKAIDKIPDVNVYEPSNIPDSARMLRIRQNAMEMVEKGLIFRTGSQTGIRLNLYREQINLQYPDVDDAALASLTRERILRETPDAAERMRYEISHDTLVKPILHALDTREREIRERADREERLRLDREETARKSREIGVSGQVEIEWDYIIRCVRERKAVLILGENALCDSEGVPLFKRFIETLDVIGQGLTYYEEEQLFWFKKPIERLRIAHEMKKFYDRLILSVPLLEQIAALPFSLILSFDASDLIARQLQNHSITFRSAVYNRSKIVPGELDATETERTVFNLFGSLEDDESMIITPDDAYKHLYGILGNNPIPAEIRIQLNNARVFIMYGINFSRTINQPVLWQLLFDNRESLRLSLLQEPDMRKEEHQAKALLNIDFKSISPQDFFNGLIQRSSSKEESVSVKGSSKDFSLKSQEIKGMIKEGALDLALQTLNNFLLESGLADRSELISISSRFNQLTRTYQAGSSSYEDAHRSRTTLTRELLNFLDIIDKNL